MRGTGLMSALGLAAGLSLLLVAVDSAAAGQGGAIRTSPEGSQLPTATTICGYVVEFTPADPFEHESGTLSLGGGAGFTGQIAPEALVDPDSAAYLASLADIEKPGFICLAVVVDDGTVISLARVLETRICGPVTFDTGILSVDRLVLPNVSVPTALDGFLEVAAATGAELCLDLIGIHADNIAKLEGHGSATACPTRARLVTTDAVELSPVLNFAARVPTSLLDVDELILLQASLGGGPAVCVSMTVAGVLMVDAEVTGLDHAESPSPSPVVLPDAAVGSGSGLLGSAMLLMLLGLLAVVPRLRR